MDKQEGYISQRLELLAVRAEEVEKKWKEHVIAIDPALAPEPPSEGEDKMQESNPNSQVANNVDLLIRKLEKLLSNMNDIETRVQL